MTGWLSKIFEPFWKTKRAKFKIVTPANPYKVIVTQSCVKSILDCLRPEIDKRNEGIAYLYGQTDGKTTLAVGAIRPEAITSSGSFHVSPLAMSKVVRVACNVGLKIVAQVHTHPGVAYHSNGDNEGARLAYSGYVSLVLPDYGRHLPDLIGSALYMYQSENNGFVELQLTDTVIVPEVL